MLSTIFNILHFLMLFLPVYIFFIPIKHVSFYFKYMFLFLILTPIHWVFFDNKCIITIFTEKSGDFKDTESDSSFSEKYLKWLYKPIMDQIGWKWDNKGIDKMVNLHWGINFIILWYYLFFYGKCKLI